MSDLTREAADDSTQPATGCGPSPPPRRAALAAVDHAFVRLRRTIAEPPVTRLPVPGLNRRVDLPTVLACEAVAECARTGEPVGVKDVAGLLQLEQSTTSRMVGEAEDAGYLHRGTHPRDARRAALTLTSDGAVLVEHTCALRQRFLDEVTRDWDADDVETLGVLLGRFADSLTTCLPQRNDLSRLLDLVGERTAPQAPR